MRIAILSDLHANLPFAEAAIREARLAGADRIAHLGDAIDLGPWPSETLDFLVNEHVEMVRGNHDEYPVLGLTPEFDARISREIRDHMEWTTAQLRADQLAFLAGLPPVLVSRADEWRLRLQHFLLDGDRVSERVVDRSPQAMMEAFQVTAGEIVCFGHIHTRSWYYSGDRGYLNPGATGFLGDDGGFFATLVVQEGSAWVEWRRVECPHHYVIAELEERNVPGWESSAVYMFAEAV